MVGLLMLKHIRNLSDESVVEQWSENNYFQYFTGETFFVQLRIGGVSDIFFLYGGVYIYMGV